MLSVHLVAWSGALVFALSLAYGIHAYVVDYGVVVAGTRGWLRPVAVNVLLFSVFAVHHSVLARTGIKQAVVRHVGPALERPLYIWLSSLLFVGCCALWQPVPGVLYTWPAGWAPWLVGIQWLGGVVTALAARRLDVVALAGVRRTPADAQPRPLETSGLYGVVRHPIYLGWVLLVVAAPVMTATRACFALISIAYLVAAVPFEERGLVAAYGDTYRAYQRKVRARIIPGVY